MATELEVLERLQSIFREVFDDSDIQLSRATTALDIDAWDSLTNIQLLVAIEQEFGIRYSSTQISDLQHVGELVDVTVGLL